MSASAMTRCRSPRSQASRSRQQSNPRLQDRPEPSLPPAICPRARSRHLSKMDRLTRPTSSWCGSPGRTIVHKLSVPRPLIARRPFSLGCLIHRRPVADFPQAPCGLTSGGDRLYRSNHASPRLSDSCLRMLAYRLPVQSCQASGHLRLRLHSHPCVDHVING